MIVGITRIRNESEIIEDTLNHFLQWCDRIYVYDDCSTDNTVEICQSINNVNVVCGVYWNPNRLIAEYETRQCILERAQQSNPDWLIYFDADERIEYDFENYEQYDAVCMRLFDFYITKEDIDKPYYQRQWLGPEYRNIIMLFRNHPSLKYNIPDQRIVSIPINYQILFAGAVKHYGKAISIKEWEKTCDYYAENFPEPYRTDRKSVV